MPLELPVAGDTKLTAKFLFPFSVGGDYSVEMPNDDLTLLWNYANHSEAAFATLVSRHIDLVYPVAMQQARDPHLAEENMQAIFIILAKKLAACHNIPRCLAGCAAWRAMPAPRL